MSNEVAPPRRTRRRSVEIVDLTQPLSESTPVIKLPPPFANTPGLSREEISHYDDAGPAWAWYTLTIGEHVGTHLDAPIHWVTGQDGNDVASVPPKQLSARLASSTRRHETEARQRLPAHRGGPRDLGGGERPRSRTARGSCSGPAGSRAPRTRPRS